MGNSMEKQRTALVWDRLAAAQPFRTTAAFPLDETATATPATSQTHAHELREQSIMVAVKSLDECYNKIAGCCMEAALEGVAHFSVALTLECSDSPTRAELVETQQLPRLRINSADLAILENVLQRHLVKVQRQKSATVFMLSWEIERAERQELVWDLLGREIVSPASTPPWRLRRASSRTVREMGLLGQQLRRNLIAACAAALSKAAKCVSQELITAANFGSYKARFAVGPPFDPNRSALAQFISTPDGVLRGRLQLNELDADLLRRLLRQHQLRLFYSAVNGTDYVKVSWKVYRPWVVSNGVRSKLDTHPMDTVSPSAPPFVPVPTTAHIDDSDTDTGYAGHGAQTPGNISPEYYRRFSLHAENAAVPDLFPPPPFVQFHAGHAHEIQQETVVAQPTSSVNLAQRPVAEMTSEVPAGKHWQEYLREVMMDSSARALGAVWHALAEEAKHAASQSGHTLRVPLTMIRQPSDGIKLARLYAPLRLGITDRDLKVLQSYLRSKMYSTSEENGCLVIHW
eukprot:TRINITY_DN94398_c0_g1_i1.p1 TRINITY_DN94398_c0_g1~~TRINITY_DN94398_c0_g1_i1.p1  ORF type:complete len:517 (+),score=62.64 TRINITY_DN94398_c0_g1_i1:428-1978(+)